MKNRPTRSIFQYRLDQMIDTIKNGVRDGTLQIGEFLPAETELAEQYQMSKNSVRKGLEQLVMEGIIEKIPRVGNRIAAPVPLQTTLVRFACHYSLLREARLEQLIERFHQLHPNIRIQMIPLPEDHYLETIQTYIKHDLIDMLCLNIDQYQVFLKDDSYKLLECLEQDEYCYPFLHDIFTADGQLYLRPLVFSPVILCYNRDHYTEQRLPHPDGSWTWNHLLEVADKLTVQHQRYGFFCHLLSQNRWPVLLHQNRFLYDRSSGAYNEDIFVESMSLWKKLFFNQDMMPVFLSERDKDAEDLFAKQKVSMIMTTYFNLNHLMDSGIPFEVAPLPFIKEPKTLILSIGAGILQHTKVQAEAQVFLNYLTSYESQLVIRKQTYSIPAHKEAAEWFGEEEIYRPDQFHIYQDITDTFRKFTDLGMNSHELRGLRNELRLYWSGIMDEKQLREQMRRILQ